MKKILTIGIIALAMLALFTSCQKEGVFNPSKKISKIYYQSGSNSKYLAERWTWDGNKLSRIQDGDNDIVYQFTYDGNKISKIKEYGEVDYIFTYDGSKISKIDIKEGGTLLATAAFSHAKSKISRLVVSFYEGGKKATELKLLKSFLPNLSEFIVKNKTRATAEFTITADYKWDGSNVSKISMEYQEGSEIETEDIAFKYDSKSNPYYGLLIAGEGVLNYIGLSKNNITEEEYTDGQYVDTYEYSYRYDGKYPTEVMRINNGYTYTTFYEYE